MRSRGFREDRPVGPPVNTSKPDQKPDLRSCAAWRSARAAAPAESVRTTISRLRLATTSRGSCSSASSTNRRSVLSGGVERGVARSQQARQRFARLVEVGLQRVKPEAALVVPGGALLLGMRGDQRRVDIDHDPLGRPSPAPMPAPAPRRAPRGRVKQPRLGGDPVDQPKRRRVRRDRPEQRLLIAHRAQVRQAVAAIGEHHRQIPDHPARVMPAAPLDAPPPARTTAPRVSPTRSATSASNAAPACDTKPSPSAVTSTVNRRPSRCTLKVNLPSSILQASKPAESLLRRTVPRPRPPGPRLLHARSGLNPSDGTPFVRQPHANGAVRVRDAIATRGDRSGSATLLFNGRRRDPRRPERVSAGLTPVRSLLGEGAARRIALRPFRIGAGYCPLSGGAR